jgi:hypothetical protein
MSWLLLASSKFRSERSCDWSLRRPQAALSSLSLYVLMFIDFVRCSSQHLCIDRLFEASLIYKVRRNAFSIKKLTAELSLFGSSKCSWKSRINLGKFAIGHLIFWHLLKYAVQLCFARYHYNLGKLRAWIKIMKKEPVHDLYQVSTTWGNSHKAEAKIRSKLHKTTTFWAYMTGQYHLLIFLLKSTRFGAWRYKLDWFSSNRVLTAVLTIGAHL